MTVGFGILLFMFAGWFSAVIKESEERFYNDAVDRSFRMGMMWFIFSEVMFFAAFFGALWYARHFSVPWLGGEGTRAITKIILRRQLRERPGRPTVRAMWAATSM